MTSWRTRRAEPPAFTLIELLTVIAIIAVLMSLIFSASASVREGARRTQAKHDVLQLVAAINAYYTDYGIYPVKPQPPGEATEVTFATDNSDLMNTLRAIPQGVNSRNVLNPRQVSFIEAPAVRDPAHPHNGVSTNGIWYDPWGPQGGKPESGIYHVRIDATYSNSVSDPYPGDAEKGGDSMDSGSSWQTGSRPGATIPLGAIAWSLARTGVQTYELQDQVLSWK
jgi:prepilin-type N-terminal cleavage/methylation domain-containing protein